MAQPRRIRTNHHHIPTRSDPPRRRALPTWRHAPVLPAYLLDPSPTSPIGIGIGDLEIVYHNQNRPHGHLVAVNTINATHIVPLAARRSIIEALAREPGIRWYGTGRDVAGRPAAAAVGISHHNDRHLLLLHETTGELLAYVHTRIHRTRHHVLTYTLYTKRGNQPATSTTTEQP